MIIDDEAGWSTVPDEHLTRHASAITSDEREARYGQRPATVFLTGLTGSGKSAIATALERRLFEAGRGTIRLDGENMRLGVSRDLGFTAAERSENVRRAAEMSRLVNDQGLICIAALVAPKASVREKARELVGSDRFIGIYLDAPVEVCRERDDSGVYEAADRGDISSLPGVSAPYEVPTDADIVLDTVGEDVATCVDRIVVFLDERGFLSPQRRTT